MDLNALLVNIVPFFVLIAVAYFAIIRPGQKRNRKQQELMRSLKRGDKVVTIGGIHGTVRQVDTATVTIAVNTKGQELTFDKAAVKETRPS